MSSFIGGVRLKYTRDRAEREGLGPPAAEVSSSLGGYSGEVPPLPIPNREVKLANADGTALIVWESR